VFGGVYCLKRSTRSILIGSDRQATGIMCDDQNLKAKLILVEDSLNPLATIKSGISRAILVTNKYVVCRIDKGDDIFLILRFGPL